MKVIRARWCSATGFPEISKRCSHPLLGGMAFVERPAESTSGIELARVRLHYLSYIWTRGLKRRRDAEGDARQQRKADAEEQRRHIDADRCFMREREFRQPVHDKFLQAICQRHANDRSRKRQH